MKDHIINAVLILINVFVFLPLWAICSIVWSVTMDVVKLAKKFA